MTAAENAAFLDSCMIFNKLLSEDFEKTNKFFEDSLKKDVNLYLSTSVSDECDKKIEDTISFLGDNLKVMILGAFGYLLDEQGKDDDYIIQFEDLITIEKVFIETYYRPRLDSATRAEYNKSLSTSIKTMEHFIVTMIETFLDRGEQITVSDLKIKLAEIVLEWASQLQNAYDDLEIMEDPKITKLSLSSEWRLATGLRTIGLHSPDDDHIASAVMYQEMHGAKVVFVTTDYGILLIQNEILTQCNLSCSNPLYAIHHFQ